MTIQDKQAFVAEVGDRIGYYLTGVETKMVLSDITEVACDYEMKQVNSGEVNLDCLDTFINAKDVEGKSVMTIGRYRYILESMHLKIGKSAQKITTADIRDFLAEEKARGISDHTLENVRACLSSYFTWLWKEGIIPANPCANITAIKYQKKVYPAFTEDDVEALINACDNYRDRAIVMFLYRTGARISEVCALNRDDIDFDTKSCTVAGKGKKDRRVYFNDMTALCLKSYLASRTDDLPYLFSGKRKERLTPHGVRAMLNVLGKKAGIEDVHPHRFRRTLATEMCNRGVSMAAIKNILGHENINTTSHYISLTAADVQSAYNAVM